MENGVINISNNLDRNYFEPSVLCVKERGSMTNRLADDVKLICLEASEGRHPFRFTRLGDIFKQQRYSIIHTHGWGACSFDGVLGAKWGRTQIVINGEHGAFFLHPRQVFIQKLIYRLCDAHLSVSESLKNDVARNLGIASNKIKTITNGVDCDRFNGNYDTQALFTELGLSHSDLILGNIGSLKPQKNQTLLLEAVARLKKSQPELNLRILFIGTGPDKELLEQKSVDLGIAAITHFLGLRDDIPQLLSIINLLVTTSRSEGMSNVTLESLASGVPIITTNCSGMREIIQHGKTGFILNEPTVDELSKKLIDAYYMPKEDLKLMSNFAKSFALEHHSINRMVNNYEKLYLDLWNKKNKNI